MSALTKARGGVIIHTGTLLDPLGQEMPACGGEVWITPTVDGKGKTAFCTGCGWAETRGQTYRHAVCDTELLTLGDPAEGAFCPTCNVVGELVTDGSGS